MLIRLSDSLVSIKLSLSENTDKARRTGRSTAQSKRKKKKKRRHSSSSSSRSSSGSPDRSRKAKKKKRGGRRARKDDSGSGSEDVVAVSSSDDSSGDDLSKLTPEQIRTGKITWALLNDVWPYEQRPPRLRKKNVIYQNPLDIWLSYMKKMDSLEEKKNLGQEVFSKDGKPENKFFVFG